MAEPAQKKAKTERTFLFSSEQQAPVQSPSRMQHESHVVQQTGPLQGVSVGDESMVVEEHQASVQEALVESRVIPSQPKPLQVISNVGGKCALIEGMDLTSMTVFDLGQKLKQELGLGHCIHYFHDIATLCLDTHHLTTPDQTLADAGISGRTPLTYILTKELLTLRDSEGESLTVMSEVACMSEYIKTHVHDNGPNEAIAFPKHKLSLLRKAMLYCAYHQQYPPEEIQKPLRSTNLQECGVSVWDAEFIDLEQKVLFEIILLANELNIKPLLDLACAKVASMIKGKTTEEIRKTFNIVNDFTPEEEAQVREENLWCEGA